MLAIGVGCSKKMADTFKTDLRVSYPVFPDDKGDIYLAAGKPTTPTTLLVTNGGKILMSHAGVIEDFDALLKELKEIHKKQ